MTARKRPCADEILVRMSVTLAESEGHVAGHKGELLGLMRNEMNRERDFMENQLLNVSLGLLIYQWIIVRMKVRPWRVLVPASIGVWALMTLSGFGRLFTSLIQTGVF